MKDDSRFSIKRSRSGLGLFSGTNFKKGDFVIEYTGKLLTNEEADKRSGKYLFQVNSRWTVDGAGRENLSRYINHSCWPNCEVWIKGRRIMIYAKKRIRPGEELTYNYGREYFDEFIKPHGCRCDYCLGKTKRNKT